MSLGSRLGAAWRGLVVKNEGDAGWSMTIGNLEKMLRGAWGRTSKSGKAVGVESALEVATVLAVVTRIAFGVAQVPWKVYQETADGKGREEARKHSLFKLLILKPNDFMTSWSFRVTMMFHLLLVGNFFCFISRVRGEIVELLPFEPRRVSVKRQRDGSLRYSVATDAGEAREIPPELMWHVRGPSWNGWMGLEIVKLAREAIGLAMWSEETQASLQKRGGKIPGVVAFDAPLNKEQYSDLRDWLKENALVALDDLGLLILDRAAKFQSVALSGVEAQTLETRAHQIGEICRAFGLISPVMIGHPPDMAARAAMEQIFIAHVVHTLDPWYVCIEQSADVFLLGDDWDKGYFTRFIRAGLMRGALKDQAEWFAKALGVGATGKGQAWATPNEIRAMLEWNPRPGGDDLPDPSAGRAPTPPTVN